MKKIFLILLLVVLTLFCILLIAENPSLVTFNFYFITHETKLSTLIIMTFITGLLFGVLIMSISVMRNKFQVGKTKRKLNKVEKEVQNLRAAPITAPTNDEK